MVDVWNGCQAELTTEKGERGTIDELESDWIPIGNQIVGSPHEQADNDKK